MQQGSVDRIDTASMLQLMRAGVVWMCDLSGVSGYMAQKALIKNVHTLAQSPDQKAWATAYPSIFVNALVADASLAPLWRYRLMQCYLSDDRKYIGHYLTWSPTHSRVIVSVLQEPSRRFGCFTERFIWDSHEGTPLTLEKARELLGPLLDWFWTPYMDLSSSYIYTMQQIPTLAALPPGLLTTIVSYLPI